MITTIAVRTEDEPFLFQVYASTRYDEIDQWGWDQAAVQAFLSLQWNAQQRSYAMQYPNAYRHVIVFQNQKAGRVIIDRRENRIRLVDLSLLPIFRNQGIGTRLLLQLQQEAEDCEKLVSLSVLKTNPAKYLYQRMGFKITQENDLYDFMEWRM